MFGRARNDVEAGADSMNIFFYSAVSVSRLLNDPAPNFVWTCCLSGARHEMFFSAKARLHKWFLMQAISGHTATDICRVSAATSSSDFAARILRDIAGISMKRGNFQHL